MYIIISLCKIYVFIFIKYHKFINYGTSGSNKYLGLFHKSFNLFFFIITILKILLLVAFFRV